MQTRAMSSTTLGMVSGLYVWPGHQAEMEVRIIRGETSGLGRELVNACPLGLPLRVASYQEKRAGQAKAQAWLPDFSLRAHQPAAPGALTACS